MAKNLSVFLRVADVVLAGVLTIASPFAMAAEVDSNVTLTPFVPNFTSIQVPSEGCNSKPFEPCQ